MHKTEIANINKRHESQIEIKDQQIQTLEEKLAESKNKAKEIEAKLTDKANEFEYYIKEERLRKQELEFKIKLESDKSKSIAITNREEIEHKVKLEKELENIKQIMVSLNLSFSVYISN